MPSPVLRCRLLLPFRSQLLPAAHFCMQQASALLSARTRFPRGKSPQGFLPSRPAPRPSRSFARFCRGGQPQPHNLTRGLSAVHRHKRMRTPSRAHGAEWYRNSYNKPSTRALRGALIGSAAAPPSRADFPRAKNTPRARTDKNLKNINLPKGYFLT